jgi:hypothetical protein
MLSVNFVLLTKGLLVEFISGDHCLSLAHYNAHIRSLVQTAHAVALCQGPMSSGSN